MAGDYHPSWIDLPEPVLAHVMSFIPIIERQNMLMVCHTWERCLDSPSLWKTLDCGFFLQSDICWLFQCIKKYGHYVSHLTITLNQNSKLNRENAILALKHFTNLSSNRLTHLKLCFRGINPLFYSGHDFVLALSNLVEKVAETNDKGRPGLKFLSLSEFQADFDDNFINHVSFNCLNLQYLNILNKMLVCNVTPPCIKVLVERCLHLQVLHIYHTSLSDEVLSALSQSQRGRLKRLGVVCRRDEKYSEDLSSEAWSKLALTNPDLKVELGFDHTCPLNKVAQIMKPEIPILDLHLATFTRIYAEINMASSYYYCSLEKLVVQTRPSKQLDDALLNIAQRCQKLKSLLVYCVVDKSVKERILSLHPEMKLKGSYILKTELEPEPWTVGKEEGD